MYYYPVFTDKELGLRKLIKFTITKHLSIDFNSDLPEAPNSCFFTTSDHLMPAWVILKLKSMLKGQEGIN